MFAPPAFATLLALLLVLAQNSSAQTYPAIVGLDVVFPRNDTYSPVPLMPIVFAVQNSPAAVPLALYIHWSIGKIGSSEGWLDTGMIDLTWANFTASPYFAIRSSTKLNGAEGEFMLQYTVGSSNCTESSAPHSQDQGVQSHLQWYRIYAEEWDATTQPCY